MVDGRCEREFMPLANSTECGRAALSVGIPVTSATAAIPNGTWDSNPTGCYWNVMNGVAAVYFNIGGNPIVADVQRRAICKRGVPPDQPVCCSPITTLMVSTAFSSDMVLQRNATGQQATVFGLAKANATVAVFLDGKAAGSAIAAADPPDVADGAIPNGWQVVLPPQPPSRKRSHTIRVECEGCDGEDRVVTLERVKFGDVILCAGQSNMELILGVTFSWYGQYEATDQWSHGRNISNDTALPISFAHLDHNLQLAPSDWPLLPWLKPTGQTDGHTWTPASRAGWVGLRGFSGVCWYTARALYNLRAGTADADVPLGLIEAAWGGTVIEAWVPQADQFFCSSRVCESYFDRSSNAAGARCGRAEMAPDSQPASLWNGMVHPLRQMTIYSALWYQVTPVACPSWGHASVREKGRAIQCPFFFKKGREQRRQPGRLQPAGGLCVPAAAHGVVVASRVLRERAHRRGIPVRCDLDALLVRRGGEQLYVPRPQRFILNDAAPYRFYVSRILIARDLSSLS